MPIRKQPWPISILTIILLFAFDVGIAKGQQQPQPTDSPHIRVLVANSGGKYPVAFDTPAVARSLTDDSIFVKLKPNGQLSITASKDGLTLGKSKINSDNIEIVTQSDVLKTSKNHYRSRLRIYRSPKGGLDVVNVVPLESYVASVVDGEMPIEFGAAARMAQAIAARTYALFHQKSASRNSKFDVRATVQSQKYLGLQYKNKQGRWLSGETKDARRISETTTGLVLTNEGKLICSYFSACCGGQTIDGSFFGDSPLVSVNCGHCQDCPRYRWQKSKKLTDVTGRLKGKPMDGLLTLKKSPAAAENGDNVYQLRFKNGQQIQLNRTEMRKAFFAWLPSHRFEATTKNEFLNFSGKGHGHGVGLCQWGARGMTKNGRTCLQILRHYYPGMDVVRLRF